MRKIGLVIFGVVLALFGVYVMVVEPVMAAVNSEICDGPFDPEQKEAAGCNVDKDAGTVASSVIQVVLGFIGVIAVGVMIYGGFLFLTSSGDAGKVKRGQDAIKYGLIGLVVSLLAYAIVTFVSMMVS